MLSYCLRKGKKNSERRKHVLIESLLVRIPTALRINTTVCTSTPILPPGSFGPAPATVPAAPSAGRWGHWPPSRDAHTLWPSQTSRLCPSLQGSQNQHFLRGGFPGLTTLQRLCIPFTPALSSSSLWLLLISFFLPTEGTHVSILFTKMCLAYSRHSISVYETNENIPVALPALPRVLPPVREATSFLY